MISAEPPQIVLQAPAPACADAARAEDSLKRALTASLAPAAGWTLRVEVRAERGALRAEGVLEDDKGGAVAHRVMSSSNANKECAPLVRAVGVWASLVLDAELDRARARDAANPAPAPPPPPAPVPQQKDVPNEEAETFLAHAPDRRTIEVGAGTLLMDGLGTVPLAGGGVFAVFEVGHGIFLRPALSVARTLQGDPAPALAGSWGSARIDACARLPGNYLEHRGLQLDACAGTEGGVLQLDGSTIQAGSNRTIPLWLIGPSLGLRGELASALSVEIRTAAGFNVLRGSFTNQKNETAAPSPLALRAEVGLTWRLR